MMRRTIAALATVLGVLGGGPVGAVGPSPTVPMAPTIGPATVGNASATVTWVAPATDGGSPVIGYVVTPYVGYDALPAVSFDSTATTQVVSSLTNGKTYRFRVRAINAIGAGDYSAASNAVAPSPTVPTDGDYIVMRGDSYWTIARDHLADTGAAAVSAHEHLAYWRQLMDANADRLVDPDNPDLLYAGQVLVLPRS